MKKLAFLLGLLLSLLSYPDIEVSSQEININYEISVPNIEPTLATAKLTPIVSIGEFRLTAYCNCSKCCGKWANGLTASGTVATHGRTIAVDTDVIVHGTTVIINGHEYVAEDTGSGINGNSIDIYFDSHLEALDFGIQYAEVFIRR